MIMNNNHIHKILGLHYKFGKVNIHLISKVILFFFLLKNNINLFS